LKLTRFILLFLICIFTITQGCRSSSAIERQKKFEKAAEKKRNKNMKVYEDGVKRHKNMQKEETKQQMKKTKRQSKKYNKNKRESFFKRIFGWICREKNCRN
jgi:hypothetical protein